MSSPGQDKKDQKLETKPLFHSLTPNDQVDRPQYRSIAVASLMESRSPLHQRGAAFPGPMSFNTASKKSPSKGPDGIAILPSFGVRVDRTKYTDVIPRDLPPAPFRLEMHTHFHVKLESTQRVCGVVGIKLCELDTDFVFDAEKCKWKVEYRRNAAHRVSLNIVIFKTAKQEYVIEVQRREGDITALMFLYHELKSLFRRSQLLSDKITTSNGVKRAAPKPLTTLPLSPDSIQNGVSALKGLLESKYADAQMQGVLGTISMSAIEESRSGMTGLVPQLVTLGQSKNSNVSRLVTAALARLCDHPQCRQEFIRSDGWQYIVDLATGGPNVTPEVQRESLHVVETLCSLYYEELAKSEKSVRLLKLVQEWQKIDDPRLKKHACNAHRALKEAGVLA
ncbi:Armadillo-type fold [Plasmopara halstedii]|uniref:Armadillo-type fold n=1 Tax=Plasmopara halstedii TaxID=4781 RepID=A0A0P1A530_PLAHL|nr:Armadillo-type fold [Plasmopara halstedii]CEG35173.1 Armadillo-type fold [Plasmopara halstedii]|eukprot:XP_024571542.1 Armadillo-type fold [Plasmopara halstedii]